MIQNNKSLQKIREIQNSIKSLSDQIKVLGRSEVRNIKSIEKCFDECVPLIKSKIEESQKHFKVKRMYQETLQQKQNRLLDIKLKKYDDMRKKTNVKALIFSIKHKQANQIRQQSIKHNQLMKQQKMKQKEQKIKKSQKVKTQQSMIKQKIKSFHKEKIEDLSRMKKTYQLKQQKRIMNSEKAMLSVNQQKIETHKKFVETHSSLKNLRLAMKKIRFMKPEEFTQIMNETLNETFQEDQNESFNFRKNMTVVTQANEFQSPIYGGQNRFTPGEQLITSKIISKILSPTKHFDQSF